MSYQNRVRVYIKPFDTLGDYVADWTEVTSDVVFEDLGDLSLDLDNVEYTLGVYRASSVALTLLNEFGTYSDVDVQQSMFRWRRAGSLVKFVWDIENDGNYCGSAELGQAYLTDDTEKILFTGLLDDSSLSLNLLDRKQKFQVLGLEAAFVRAKVPFSSLTGSDYISDIIYKCLNQTEITKALTVDAGNINPGLDQIPNSIAELENKTVREALDDLLLFSNSVLYISNSTVYVADRTAGLSVAYTFHGQASETARENFNSIENLKSGIARTFNFLTWQDTTLLSSDSTSIDHYGVLKKELSSDLFTNNTKRTNVLDAILAEFKDPKRELDLTAPLSYATFDLDLLNRVAIDYPTVYVTAGEDFPIIGIAVIGVAVLPKGLWSFTIDTDTNFKIIGKKLSLKKGVVTYKLREI